MLCHGIACVCDETSDVQPLPVPCSGCHARKTHGQRLEVRTTIQESTASDDVNNLACQAPLPMPPGDKTSVQELRVRRAVLAAADLNDRSNRRAFLPSFSWHVV